VATLINQPLSLAEAKRLAQSSDTVLLRATREADLETPIGAFLAIDDGTPAYLLESVEGGERLGRYSFLGVLPRRLLEVRDGTSVVRSRPVGIEHAPELEPEIRPQPDPLQALRSFLPGRKVAPLPDLPRFSGGAVGVLAYDAVARFEPTVPLPDADPVGVPLAAFLETDLVLVFDHLTHTLSAIASLHTDAPDFERRYKVAEEAVLAEQRIVVDGCLLGHVRRLALRLESVQIWSDTSSRPVGSVGVRPSIRGGPGRPPGRCRDAPPPPGPSGHRARRVPSGHRVAAGR
jgi:hypothetical protein